MENTSRIKILNDQTVQIKNEDHTMMNPLRWCIGKNFTGKKVDLVGYTIPHPSDNASNLTIQFHDENDQNSINILDKIREALDCIEVVGNKMIREIEDFKSK